jgi:hypothetical protein
LNTQERASIWASKIEEQNTALIDLGVTEENLDCLIECIRNIHMVPFSKISGFFPNSDELAFLKIQDLLGVDRPNRKITISSMEVHSDRESHFTTIGVLRDTAKYRIYPIVDKAFSKEYEPVDGVNAIRIGAEPKDLIVMGPVVLARTNEQSNVPANLPHSVTSAAGAYRLLAH